MAKYLVLWEVELSRTPADQNEKKAQWQVFQALVKEQMSSGMTRDWGQFVGEPAGYSILEGDEVELTKLMNLYTPFIKFTTRPVLSIDQVMEATEALQG